MSHLGLSGVAGRLVRLSGGCDAVSGEGIVVGVSAGGAVNTIYWVSDSLCFTYQ